MQPALKSLVSIMLLSLISTPLYATTIEQLQNQLRELQTHASIDDQAVHNLQNTILDAETDQLANLVTNAQPEPAVTLGKTANQQVQTWLTQLQALPPTDQYLEQSAILQIKRANLLTWLSLAYNYQKKTYQLRGDTHQIETLLSAALASRREANTALQTAYINSHNQTNASADDLAMLQFMTAQSPLQVAQSLCDLAEFYQQQERFQTAMPLLTESQRILENLAYPPTPSRWERFVKYWEQGWQQLFPTQASPAMTTQQAQTLRENTQNFAKTKQSVQMRLAMLYANQQQFKAAETLHLQVLKEQQQTLPANDPNLTLHLLTIGQLYEQMGDQFKDSNYYTQAVQFYQSTVDGYRQRNDPDLSMPLILLAHAYELQQRYDEAITALQQALAMEQTSLEREQSDQQDPALRQLELAYKRELLHAHRNKLGELNTLAGHYPAAIQYISQNINDKNNPLPPEHTGSKAMSLQHLAAITKLQKNIHQTLAYLNQAAAEYDAYPIDNLEQHKAKQALGLQYVTTLMKGIQLGQLPADSTLPELFQRAQQAQGSGRLAAFRQVVLRNASHDPSIRNELANLWEKQNHLQVLENMPTHATADNTASVDLTKLRQDKQQTIAAIQTLEKTLQAHFPIYQQLAHPAPLTVEQVQALLQPDEALLMWVENNSVLGSSYLLVVRANQPLRVHALDISRAQLESVLGSSQQGLRAALTHPEQEFDLNLAYGLYQQLLAPATADLQGVKHLIAVPDGLLQNLPLPVLLTSPPTAPNDYAKADWLIKHYSVSYLPSVNALADLHHLTSVTNSQPRIAFMGFGDPHLEGGKLTLTSLMRGMENPQQQDEINTTTYLNDPNLLRQALAPLPETADELRTVAQSLNRSDATTALFLQADATEARLKQLDQSGELSRVQVLSFATHALLPYQAHDTQTEAGLVLPPPIASSSADDGLLSSSEIALLHLNADWVLLSACNTATLNDTDTYAGLSGLSKAFFMAGSRSVLASQWSVSSHYTSQLVTDVFNRLHHEPPLHRAEALRQSMLHLLQAATITAPATNTSCGWWCQWRGGSVKPTITTAHPYYWAAFAIYGDWRAMR